MAWRGLKQALLAITLRPPDTSVSVIIRSTQGKIFGHQNERSNRKRDVPTGHYFAMTKLTLGFKSDMDYLNLQL
jgi:hypothetical protein